MDAASVDNLIAYAKDRTLDHQSMSEMEGLIDRFLRGECDDQTSACVEDLMLECISVTTEICHQAEQRRCMDMALNPEPLSPDDVSNLADKLFVAHMKKHGLRLQKPLASLIPIPNQLN